MRNTMTWKLAATTALIGVTMVGCSPLGGGVRTASISSKAPVSGNEAGKAFAKASAAVGERDFAKALPFAEQAVELSPQDVGYRMVLADLYVKNGRFQSAETTYRDVIALNPDNKRAAVSKALAEIAQGKKLQARATLDTVAATAPASDTGLAYALAGDIPRALSILEAAARADGADGRVRQNLALVYALAGDWQKARVTAAQDISPADVSARMEQWAAFVTPATSYDQVAGLLGVTPAADPGQPTQLALAPALPAPAALAAAAPVAVAEPAPAPAPAETFAAATPAPVAPPAETFAAAAAPEIPAAEPVEPAAAVQYAAAAETLVKPQVAVIAAPAAPYKTPVAAFEPVRKPAIRKASAPLPTVNPGRYVVQLGAYSKQESIDRAWKQAQQRYGVGGDERALTTTVSMPGKGMLHRLSVAGFDSRADATRLCASIQAKGGTCFVRGTAGDAPVQWASLRQRTRRA